MKNFKVPQQSEVSENNQKNFEQIEKSMGKVPNLYATFAHSEHALDTYLALENRKSSLTDKEQEVINLAVSQVNGCKYCLSAHVMLAKSTGFDGAEINELRHGTATFDAKLDALATFAHKTTKQRGKPAAAVTKAFLDAGYTEENLIDAIITIGDRTITNYLHGVTKIPIDFPEAPALKNQ